MTIEFLKESMMSRSFPQLGVCLCVLASVTLLQVSVAQAQTFRGTILGTVTDSSGAAVSGAQVTIKNVDTGLTRTVTTADDGSYSAPELPIGNYSVTVDKEGFKEGVASGVRVEVSSERRADFTLQPGPLAQRVEVVGEELPMVESTSNTLGGIVESKVVNDLPELVKLQLRFEFYNLLNHPNFANPLWPNFLSDPTITNSFGTNGRLQGFLPITTTADVGPGYPFLGGGGPRSIQIAAKINF